MKDKTESGIRPNSKYPSYVLYGSAATESDCQIHSFLGL